MDTLPVATFARQQSDRNGFSKLKALFRKMKARTYHELRKAAGKVCDLFTPQECWNYSVKLDALHINRPML
jgi:hypothetical protein